jgi:hypothetical protein
LIHDFNRVKCALKLKKIKEKKILMKSEN